MAELPIVDAETGQVPDHVHSWQVRAAELFDMPRLFMTPQQSTRVLLICTQCGWPETTTLAGRWTIGQLK